MPCLKEPGIQESSDSTTNFATWARSEAGRALICSIISCTLTIQRILHQAPHRKTDSPPACVRSLPAAVAPPSLPLVNRAAAQSFSALVPISAFRCQMSALIRSYPTRFRHLASGKPGLGFACVTARLCRPPQSLNSAFQCFRFSPHLRQKRASGSNSVVPHSGQARAFRARDACCSSREKIPVGTAMIP